MQTVIAPRGCYLVALAREVDEGEHVEVDDETAESLIEQGWDVAAVGVGASKAAARRARADDEHDSQDHGGAEPPTDQPAETVEES
jgi:hypothetical protein